MRKLVLYSILTEILFCVFLLTIQINHVYFPFRGALFIVTLTGLCLTLCLSVYWFVKGLIKPQNHFK